MSRPRIAIPVPTSFDAAYNQRTWPQYATAVERAGGEPVEIALDNPEASEAQAAGCDAVLLPGSAADVDPQRYGRVREANAAAADPKREAVDLRLLNAAQSVKKPVLAICFGSQMLNVWRGGSLVQHLDEAPINHRQRGADEAHQVEIVPGSLLGDIVAPGSAEGGTIGVNSSHHQAVEVPGRGLRVIARSNDGVVEALEGEDRSQFVLAVQWHPERTYDLSRESRVIFDRLIREAGQWHRSSR